MREGLTRREMLAAAAAAGAATALAPGVARAAGISQRFDFRAFPDADGWGPAWRTVSVANLRVAGGAAVLEAGSDVFPNDPRAVAFATDLRHRDGEIRALITRPGWASGVVLRRTGPRAWYAAVHDDEQRALVILRRTENELVELARTEVVTARAPLTLALRASGASLDATLTDTLGRTFTAGATDATPALQRPGDPGVLATARTYLTSEPDDPAALGNARLGFFGTQEGGSLAGTPAGQAFIDRVRERSTAAFAEITIESAEEPRATRPSIVAATTGLPGRRGARVNVATDVPADIWIDYSYRADMKRRQTVRVGSTGEFDALIARLRKLERGRRVYWRARARRNGIRGRSPVRSFRVLPRAGARKRVTLSVAACGMQFGPIFDQIAARAADVFIWQGDLNYPDTNGPLMQSMSGYAGNWRDFLTNPKLEATLSRSAFVPQRDDHDYGLQDAAAGNLVAHGLAPFEALMNNRIRHRFAGGMAEVWVLNERHFKSDPTLPDNPEKTLLGLPQREWLMRTLARSRAPFKVICSPCTLHYGGNARDGNWDAGFRAERDLLLEHIANRVSGTTVFLTGDAHDTMVYERDGVFEARACPVDIPDPRDHPGVQAGMFDGEGVVYASTENHFTFVDTRAEGGRAVMDVVLVNESGGEPYRKRFEEQLPRRNRR